MADITAGNWADFAAVADTTLWTIDLTNRIFEFTGDTSLAVNQWISFNEDFDDTTPVTLLIPKISQQTANVTIRMHNATIYYTRGPSGLGGNFNPTFSGPSTATNVVLDIQDCAFIASNGATNGLGAGGARSATNVTGTLSNCDFFGINTGTIWFVNVAGLPLVTLTDNSYNQTALHSGEFDGGDADDYPTVITGSLDGTTRTSEGGGYTIRRVRYTLSLIHI